MANSCDSGSIQDTIGITYIGPKMHHGSVNGIVPRIDDFFKLTGDTVTFDQYQVGRFARDVAKDFNPIHDSANDKFCVPGDLLFGVCLLRYGVGRSNKLEFMERVRAGDTLRFSDNIGTDRFAVNGKGMKALKFQSEPYAVSSDASSISLLAIKSAERSGMVFEEVLHEPLRSHSLMLNSRRPLVFYKRMEITCNQFIPSSIRLGIPSVELKLLGKRAELIAMYPIITPNSNSLIGAVRKDLVVGGLQEYCTNSMMEFKSNLDRFRGL